MEKLIKNSCRPLFPAGRWGSVLFSLLALVTISCSGLPFKEAGPSGVYHRVKSGETLSAIAKAYHADLQSLAEINNITDPSLIEKDSVIFIPNAPAVIDEIEIISRSKKTAVKIPAKAPVTDKREVSGDPAAGVRDAGKKAGADQKKPTQVPVDLLKEETIDPSRDSGKPLAVPNDSEKAARKDKELKPDKETLKPEKQDQVQEKQEKQDQEKQDQVRFNKGIFIWPLRGKVISFFGIQPSGMFFNGIRIAAPAGAAVFAVGDGVVIHSDFLKYYGETVIIQHADDYASVYANLGIRAVTVKSRVKKGDRIGFLGNPSGNEEAYLHFEIRHKNKARNPLFFLP